MKKFRWCKIDQPPMLFRHPLAARKLAMWLSQTLFAFKAHGHSEERPMLLVVRDVVSATGRERTWSLAGLRILISVWELRLHRSLIRMSSLTLLLFVAL